MTEQVYINFDNASFNKIESLPPLNLKIVSGKIYSIIEWNHANEFLRSIIEKEFQYQGNITYFEEHNRNSQSPRLPMKEKLKIGYSMASEGLLSNLSIFDNIDLPAKYHNFYEDDISTPGHLTEKILRELNISQDYWNKRPHEVTEYCKKMTLIARAFVLSPKVIIIEGTTIGLTLKESNFLARWILEKKNEGHTFLLSSNNINFVDRVSDYIFDFEKTTFTEEVSRYLSELEGDTKE